MEKKYSYDELLKKVEVQEKEIQILKAIQNGGLKNTFQTFFDDSHFIMLLIDVETGQIINANKSACEFYGYSSEEITSMNIMQINTFPEEQVIQEMQNVKSGKRNLLHFRHKLKNGSIKDIEDHAGIILLDNKTYLYSIIIDVTEKKQSELLLQEKSEEITTQNEELNQANQELIAAKGRAEESENKWKTLVKTIPDWIAIIDKDDKFVFMNQFAKGFNEGDVIGVSVLDFILGPSKQVFSDAINKTRETKTVQGFEHFAYGDNMSESYYHNFMVPMDLKEGSILIISRDITERKQSEIALIRSERELKNAQQIAHMGNWVLDIINNKLFWSDEIYRIFDCEPQEFNATYEAFLEFIHPEDKEKVNAAYSNSLETQTEYEIEHRLITKTNKIKFVKEKCSTTFNELGKPLSSFGIVIDITEQKQIEIELQKAKEKAEESDRLKSAFLANMSHEIRTPMNGILGFAQLLKTPGLKGEKQQAFIEIIEKSGNRMLNIINDIIDISKIESGLMNLDSVETNINEQVEDIYTFFKPEAEAKGIKFSFRNTLPAKEAIIKTDSEKVYAILTNLVKNAIKYTPEGSIEFGYHLKKHDEAGELKFYVKDTGIGIPKESHKAIFERFVQADIADKMAHQGAGLGLAITKAYVEMLGGNIWVESEEAKGSTFYFTLPYNTETVKDNIDRQHPLSGKNKTVRNLKILIAEDDEISKLLLDETVKIYGEEILIARTGFETIEVCRTNPDIDLILMDIRMPDMGGYEAIKQIREFNKEVIIIAQTAYALSGDKEKAMEAGCNDYLAKPINENGLHAMIQKYFGK